MFIRIFVSVIVCDQNEIITNVHLTKEDAMYHVQRTDVNRTNHFFWEVCEKYVSIAENNIIDKIDYHEKLFFDADTYLNPKEP